MKRTCERCGSPFDSPSGRAKYCSQRCRQAVRDERRRLSDQGDLGAGLSSPAKVDLAELARLRAALTGVDNVAAVDALLGWGGEALASLTTPGQRASFGWRLLRTLAELVELRAKLTVKPAEPAEPAVDPGVAQLHALQAKAAARRAQVARLVGDGDG